MYGLIVKLIAVPGKRDEMIAILKESAANMPGCVSYVLAKDSSDENLVWVTEVWESAASHDASLSLPSVKNAMPRVNLSCQTSRESRSQLRSGASASRRHKPNNRHRWHRHSCLPREPKSLYAFVCAAHVAPLSVAIAPRKKPFNLSAALYSHPS